MTIQLGTQPLAVNVNIQADADFFSTLTNSEGDWDPGTVISLRFSDDTVWTATITGPDASFSVDKALVNALITAKVKAVKLFYVNGTTDVCWGTGTVTKRA